MKKQFLIVTLILTTPITMQAMLGKAATALVLAGAPALGVAHIKHERAMVALQLRREESQKAKEDYAKYRIAFPCVTAEKSSQFVQIIIPQKELDAMDASHTRYLAKNVGDCNRKIRRRQFAHKMVLVSGATVIAGLAAVTPWGKAVRTKIAPQLARFKTK